MNIKKETWTLEIQHTTYDAQRQLFSIDYDKLRFLVQEHDNSIISECITIVNPISGYVCSFQLKFYEGDDNINPDLDGLQPNEVARYGAWYDHGGGDEEYYEVSVTKPIVRDDNVWVDVSDKLQDKWIPYLTSVVDPYQDQESGYLDSDAMIKTIIADWYEKVGIKQ